MNIVKIDQQIFKLMNLINNLYEHNTCINTDVINNIKNNISKLHEEIKETINESDLSDFIAFHLGIDVSNNYEAKEILSKFISYSNNKYDIDEFLNKI